MTSCGGITVLHVVVSLDCGGLERLVVEWANARHETCPGSTRVGCLDRAGQLAADCAAPVHVIGAGRDLFPFDVAAVLRLKQLIRGNGVDVVHSHNLAAQQYTALALVGLKRRVGHVHTEHGTNPHTSGFLNRRRGKWLYRRCDAYVAVAGETAAVLAAAWGVDRSAITVVRNGIRADRHEWAEGRDENRRAARETLGVADETFVIGSVGRLSPEKGYDRLIRAVAETVLKQRSEGGGRSSEFGVGMSQVVGRGGLGSTGRYSRVSDIDAAPCSLILIGDGPEKRGLQNLASELGVEKQTVFLGFRPDVASLLPGMDLFVLPSRSEGLSVALLEAMAAGVPVLVTDVGESRTVLDGGACGTILPGDETEWPCAISAEMDLVMSSKREDAVIGAVRRVRTSYSIERTMDAYERIYAAAAG